MAASPVTPTLNLPPRLHVLRLGPVSFRINVRTLVFTIIALAALAAMAAWGMTLGSFRLSIGEVVAALTGSGSSDANFIVLDLRLPRVLVAIMVGPMLAMSGAVFQGLVRNPLVSPDIIGINAGAALVAVFWIVTGQPFALLPVAAFAGALGAASLVYLFTWKGHISGARLVLVGIGINALLSAGITFLIVRSDINDVSRAVVWMAGSVHGSDWDDVRVLAFGLGLLLPITVGLVWSLGALQMGDIAARSIGLPLERTRLALIVIGSALSALAVSVAGPIGFVALVVPHIARMLAGPMSGGVLVFTAALGSVLLLGSDLIGQHALPVTMPVGVITAVIGAPYFLFLLYRVNTRI